MSRLHRTLPAGPAALALTLALALPLPAGANSVAPSAPAADDEPVLRRRSVAPLPGGLDQVPMFNDNNPELIREAGILLSGFDGRRGYAGRALGVPQAHLDTPLNGTFELFSHHVYAGKPEELDSTLWLAVVGAPRGTRPVRLRLLSGSTALSQSLDPVQPDAPFLPLPTLMPQRGEGVWAGPGSRVATELLERYRSPLFPGEWTLPPRRLTVLAVLPLPVRGLDPLLNGRNLQWRLQSDAPVDIATLAAFGPNDAPPPEQVWAKVLDGPLSPREHAPTPRGRPGKLVYSRVSGVQRGSTWRSRITDPGRDSLSVRRAPISWPISSLEQGTLGTAQVQTAELESFVPGTAWAAHGNYGVGYDLLIPLRNDTAAPVRLRLALESPLKHDRPLGGLRFRPKAGPAVTFRGTVEVRGLDAAEGATMARRAFHLVLRSGEEGPPLGTVSLAPGERRELRVRLIYPADATPPQVLSLLPDGDAGAAVKQSGAPPSAATP